MQNEKFHNHDVTGDEIDLRQLWIIIRRGRWTILGILAVVLGLTSFYTLWTPPVYEATTMVRIDEAQASAPVLDIFGSLGGGSEVETEMEILKTRVLAESVIDSLGLRLSITEPKRVRRSDLIDYIHIERDAPEGAYSLERNGDQQFALHNLETGEVVGTYGVTERIRLPGAVVVVSPEAVNQRRIRFEIISSERAIQSLLNSITVTRPNPQANVVLIRHQNTDTDLVRIVPNTLAELFIAQRVDIKKTETRSTITFLTEQIDTLTRQLTGAEEELQEFRERGQIVSIEAEASTQVRELAALQAERNQIDAERAALAELLSEVQAIDPNPGEPSPYRRLIAFPSLYRNQATTELLRTLNAAENERAEILRRRTVKDPDVQLLTSRIGELEEQLRVIAVTYLQGLTNQVNSLDATLAAFGSELERVPEKEIQFARLVRQTGLLEEIFTLLQTRLKEAEIAQAVEDVSVRIVDPARTPPLPIKPRKAINLLLGGILGTLLGTGTVLFRTFLDNTVRTREDLQELVNAPVLGLIPRIRGEDRISLNVVGSFGGSPKPELDLDTIGLGNSLIAGRDPRNPITEAYRGLRTNITFARPKNLVRTLVFTSPGIGDGKSTTSANLAIVLAQQGHSVLLVDADLRRGLLHSTFGLSAREPGLSNVLLGTDTLTSTIKKLPLGDGIELDLLTTGTLPPNPAELLGSERLRGLLTDAESQYDVVILDAPPLTLVTDAALLGTNADGVILVARARQTHKDAITFAYDQLRYVRAPVLGTVLNDVDFRRDGYYGGYGYYDAYYHDSKPTKTRSRLRSLLGQ